MKRLLAGVPVLAISVLVTVTPLQQVNTATYPERWETTLSPWPQLDLLWLCRMTHLLSQKERKPTRIRKSTWPAGFWSSSIPWRWCLWSYGGRQIFDEEVDSTAQSGQEDWALCVMKGLRKCDLPYPLSMLFFKHRRRWQTMDGITGRIALTWRKSHQLQDILHCPHETADWRIVLYCAKVGHGNVRLAVTSFVSNSKVCSE